MRLALNLQSSSLYLLSVGITDMYHVICHLCIIPVLGRQRQEDLKIKASLGYIVRLCLIFFLL
jgi:hypothetical protein